MRTSIASAWTSRERHQVALEQLATSLRADLKFADDYVANLSVWSEVVPDGYAIDAAARRLHHLYGAVEDFVVRALKIFDGQVPSGDDSHIRLLEQGSLEVPGKRGVILPKSDAIDELRRFRHRFRKRYDADLDVGLLHPVVKNAVAAWPTIRAHLVDFVSWVETCAKEAE